MLLGPVLAACGDDTSSGSGGSDGESGSATGGGATTAGGTPSATSSSSTTSGDGGAADGGGGGGGGGEAEGGGGAGGISTFAGCPFVEPGLGDGGEADWVVLSVAWEDDPFTRAVLAVDLLADPPVAELLAADGEADGAGWSPDGETYAFVANDQLELWAMGDGTPERLATLPFGGRVRGWDPGGSTIVVDGGDVIHLVDAASGESAAVSYPTNGFELTWSPGGRWLLIAAYQAPFLAVDRTDPSHVVAIDPACEDADASPFVGERGFMCLVEGQEHAYVPLGDDATGEAFFVSAGLSAFTYDLAVIDADRLVYSGEGPDGVGVYAATVSEAGLADHQRLLDEAGQVHRAGARLYVERNSGITLFGLDLVEGLLPELALLGSGWRLSAFDASGRWLVVDDGLVDAADLAAPVLHELPLGMTFIGRFAFAPEGGGLFYYAPEQLFEDGTWGWIDLTQPSLEAMPLVVSGQSGRAQDRAATRLVLQGGAVFEVVNGVAEPRLDLPCVDLPDVLAAPQPPVGPAY